MPARIFAIVDVWDALRTDRPYRRRWNEDKAVRYVVEQSGKQFDPNVVEIFLTKVLNLGSGVDSSSPEGIQELIGSSTKMEKPDWQSGPSLIGRGELDLRP